MIKYIFEEYKGAKGTIEAFDTAEEAIERAEHEWYHLTKKEQDAYKEDPAGQFQVARYELVWSEDDEDYYLPGDPEEIILDMKHKYMVTLGIEWDRSRILDGLMAMSNAVTMGNQYDVLRDLERIVNQEAWLEWDMFERKLWLDWDKTADDFERVVEETAEMITFELED